MGDNSFQDIKYKFGFLLHQLVVSGFAFEYIEHKIIHNDYFLFFEKNNVGQFMGDSIEDIVLRIFNKQIHIDYSNPIASETIWAGQIYITLLFNYRIPLQRSMLLCPIAKMLSFYNPYHEMNDIKICKRYIEEKNKLSIFRLILRYEPSIRKISLLTGINQRTLESYMDNQKFFSMSFENAYKLSRFLDYPIEIFLKESNYSPNISVLFKDETFKIIFCKILSNYYSVDELMVKLVDESTNKKDLLQLLRKYKIIFDTTHYVGIKKNGSTVKYLILKQSEKNNMNNLAIKMFKDMIDNDVLLF